MIHTDGRPTIANYGTPIPEAKPEEPRCPGPCPKCAAEYLDRKDEVDDLRRAGL